MNDAWATYLLPFLWYAVHLYILLSPSKNRLLHVNAHVGHSMTGTERQNGANKER